MPGPIIIKKKIKKFNSKITNIPGDKSISIRTILLGSLASIGKSKIKGLPYKSNLFRYNGTFFDLMDGFKNNLQTYRSNKSFSATVWSLAHNRYIFQAIKSVTNRLRQVSEHQSPIIRCNNTVLCFY